MVESQVGFSLFPMGPAPPTPGPLSMLCVFGDLDGLERARLTSGLGSFVWSCELYAVAPALLGFVERLIGACDEKHCTAFERMTDRPK